MKVTRARMIGAAIAVAVVVAIGFAMRPKPLVVDTATVARTSLESTVDADGRTRVRDRYVVVAPVSGRVDRITRVEGALVRTGDVVARLRPLPLDSQAVTQAQARVDAATAMALEADAQVRVANAVLDQRRRELSRAQRLVEVGGVAPRVVEETELARVQAEEAIRAVSERARAAAADVRQARAALLGVNREGGPMVAVRAPASGRILRVSERSERIVTAGTPLLELGDLSSLEVVIDVLSSDAATIHLGDRVRLNEWGGGGTDGEQTKPIGGRVREIEPAGFTKVSALGVEEQRVNVIVDLDRVPPGLGDGFRVDASVITWSAPSVVVVPRSALLQRNGPDGSASEVWSAFVVRSGSIELRSVRIGHVGGVGAEVLAGIDTGDEVVLFPSDQVKPGIRASARKS